MKQKSYIIDNKELMSEWDWDANAELDPISIPDILLSHNFA